MAAKTRDARVEDVGDAITKLPALYAAAVRAEKRKGGDHVDVLALWAEVELVGAVVHRQSRLLAGKPRGG